MPPDASSREAQKKSLAAKSQLEGAAPNMSCGARGMVLIDTAQSYTNGRLAAVSLVTLRLLQELLLTV